MKSSCIYSSAMDMLVELIPTLLKFAVIEISVNKEQCIRS